MPLVEREVPAWHEIVRDGADQRKSESGNAQEAGRESTKKQSRQRRRDDSRRGLDKFGKTPERALQQLAVQRLMGFMKQIGALAEFSADMMQDLHHETTKLSKKIQSVDQRVQAVRENIRAGNSARSDGINKEGAHNESATLPMIIMNLEPDVQGKRFVTQKRSTNKQNSSSLNTTERRPLSYDSLQSTNTELPLTDLLKESTRSAALKSLYASAKPPPNLQALDRFVDNGDLQESCLRRFTKPYVCTPVTPNSSTHQDDLAVSPAVTTGIPPSTSSFSSAQQYAVTSQPDQQRTAHSTRTAYNQAQPAPQRQPRQVVPFRDPVYVSAPPSSKPPHDDGFLEASISRQQLKQEASAESNNDDEEDNPFEESDLDSSFGDPCDRADEDGFFSQNAGKSVDYLEKRSFQGDTPTPYNNNARTHYENEFNTPPHVLGTPASAPRETSPSPHLIHQDSSGLSSPAPSWGVHPCGQPPAPPAQTAAISQPPRPPVASNGQANRGDLLASIRNRGGGGLRPVGKQSESAKTAAGAASAGGQNDLLSAISNAAKLRAGTNHARTSSSPPAPPSASSSLVSAIRSAANQRASNASNQHSTTHARTTSSPLPPRSPSPQSSMANSGGGNLLDSIRAAANQRANETSVSSTPPPVPPAQQRNISPPKAVEGGDLMSSIRNANLQRSNLSSFASMPKGPPPVPTNSRRSGQAVAPPIPQSTHSTASTKAPPPIPTQKSGSQTGLGMGGGTSADRGDLLAAIRAAKKPTGAKNAPSSKEISSARAPVVPQSRKDPQSELLAALQAKSKRVSIGQASPSPIPSRAPAPPALPSQSLRREHPAQKSLVSEIHATRSNTSSNTFSSASTHASTSAPPSQGNLMAAIRAAKKPTESTTKAGLHKETPVILRQQGPPEPPNNTPMHSRPPVLIGGAGPSADRGDLMAAIRAAKKPNASTASAQKPIPRQNQPPPVPQARKDPQSELLAAISKRRAAVFP